MGTTDLNQIPYPDATDQPYVHLDMKALAERIAQLMRVECTSTTRPPHRNGREIYETDLKRAYRSNGTRWLGVDPKPSIAVNLVSTAGYPEGSWLSAPLNTTPSTAATLDTEGVFTIDAVNRTLLVNEPGLYQVTARPVTADGNGNVAARLVTTAGFEISTTRLSPFAGTSPLIGVVRLAAGIGIKMDFLAYNTAGASVANSGSFTVVRLGS